MMDTHNDSIFKKALNPRRRAVEPTLRARAEAAQGTRCQSWRRSLPALPLPRAPQAPLGLAPSGSCPGAQVMRNQGWLSLQCSHTAALCAAEGAGQAKRVEGWKAGQWEERELREVLLL